MAIDFSRVARGVATGYISEVLADRRKADEERYDRIKLAENQYYNVDLPAFKAEEKIRDGNVAFVKAELGPIVANYLDAQNITLDNANTRSIVKQFKESGFTDLEKLEINSNILGRKKERRLELDDKLNTVINREQNKPGGISANIAKMFFSKPEEDIAKVGVNQGTGMDAQTQDETAQAQQPDTFTPISELLGTTGNIYNFDEHRVPRNNASNFFTGFFVNDLRQPSISFAEGTPQFVLMNELLKGYDEAEKAGFNKGKYEYARLKYIDQELKREGISGFPTGFPETKQETVKQPAEQTKDSKATVGDGTKFDAPDVSKIGVKEGINEKSRQVIDGKVVSYADASDAINKLREVISRISNSNILSDDQKEKNIDIAKERTRQKIIEMGLNPDNFNL